MRAVHHLRVLDPIDGVRAFYDGRIEGYRFADGANWVDDGALSLGIASYAIVDGSQALIYDTHVSVEHARFIRASLEAEGVRRFVASTSTVTTPPSCGWSNRECCSPATRWRTP